MSDDTNSSRQSINDATRSRVTFSQHGGSLGAAGFLSPHDDTHKGAFLSNPGDTAIVNPPEEGLPNFEIGVAWDNVKKRPSRGGFLNKITKLGKKESGPKGVDLDVGCLYELKNDKRGAIQAFGENFGAMDEPPYIFLTRDERTGETEGEDEKIIVNGAHWNDIQRIVIYIYIYSGASNWDEVKPQVQVRVPGEDPMVISLKAKRQELALCAVAEIENVRKGIRMKNLMEYFPGHAEMDRAFGFGLDWADGQKRGA